MDKLGISTGDFSFSVPDLDAAIETQPLIVAPETLLWDTVALMSGTVGRSCLIENSDPEEEALGASEVRSSCVLVVENLQLLGIFTERDLVRLTATKMDFVGVKISEVMISPVVTIKKENFKDIFAALFLFRRYAIRHLPIVDEDNLLVGLISQDSLRRVLRPANLLKLRRVREVMTPQVVHTPMNTSVLRVAQLMARHKVSCVVIVESDPEGIQRPVGIVTERDLVQFQSLHLPLSSIPAQEVMSTPLFLLQPDDSLWNAHQEMLRRRVRRLVVSWNWGQGLGIVTQSSLLRVFDPMEMYGVIDTLQHTIDQLEVDKFKLLTSQGSQNINTKLEQKVTWQDTNLPSNYVEVKQQNQPSLAKTQFREIDVVLSTIQVYLDTLVNEINIPYQVKQEYLNSVLVKIENMHTLIQAYLNKKANS